MMELHIWLAPWTTTLVVMRLDAFFAVSLCLVSLAGIMFTNAAFYYVPFYGSVPAHLLHAFVSLLLVTVVVGIVQVVVRLTRLGQRGILDEFVPTAVLLPLQPPRPGREVVVGFDEPKQETPKTHIQPKAKTAKVSFADNYNVSGRAGSGVVRATSDYERLAYVDEADEANDNNNNNGYRNRTSNNQGQLDRDQENFISSMDDCCSVPSCPPSITSTGYSRPSKPRPLGCDSSLSSCPTPAVKCSTPCCPSALCVPPKRCPESVDDLCPPCRSSSHLPMCPPSCCPPPKRCSSPPCCCLPRPCRPPPCPPPCTCPPTCIKLDPCFTPSTTNDLKKFQRIMSPDGNSATYRSTPSARVAAYRPSPPCAKPSSALQNGNPPRVSDSVRQAIARIACKSLESDGDDIQEEIDKLKAANLLPCDFQLPANDTDEQSVSSQGNDCLKQCAVRLVESIICKVKQQLESEQDQSAEQSDDEDQFVNSEPRSKAVSCARKCSQRARNKGGECESGKSGQRSNADRKRPQSSTDDGADCCDARKEVLKTSLALLDQQTQAIVRDIERVRKRVADKMVNEVTCGGTMGKSSSRESPTASDAEIVSGSLTSTKAKPAAKNNSSRRDSAPATNIPPKPVGTTNGNMQKTEKNSSSKNKSSNAITVDLSESDSDCVDETEEEEASASSDGKCEYSSEDEPQRNNSARRTKTSSQLNRNCNAATGSYFGCGRSFGGCGCCNNRVASCNTQDVIDREALCLALEANDNAKMPVSDDELRKFATELVESLYSAVRAKLSAMIDNEYADMGDNYTFPKEELLKMADQEVSDNVLSVVVDHIVWLMKEEGRALGQLDCDMMMVAFAGQFVDTIVTNAVLKTNVDLSKSRSSVRALVATSNSGNGVRNKGRKSLRKPMKFTNDEKVISVWNSDEPIEPAMPNDADAFAIYDQRPSVNENASNNCSNLAVCRWSTAASSPARGSHSWTSHPGPADALQQKHSYNTNNCGTNNNNNNGNEGDVDCGTTTSDYVVCNYAFIREKRGSHSTISDIFHVRCRLSKEVFSYKTYNSCEHSNRNDNYNAVRQTYNCNSNNNRIDILEEEYDFGDDFSDRKDVSAAAADDDDDENHCHGDDRNCFNVIGDDKYSKGDGIGQAVENSDPTKRCSITRNMSDSYDEEGTVERNREVNERPGATAVFYGDPVQGLHHHLSLTVDRFLSALGSRRLAGRALDSAGDWLRRYRDYVDSPRFCLGRVNQSYVRTGRALLDVAPTDGDFSATVDRAAMRLFRRAVDNAVRDLRHAVDDDLDDDDVRLSLIAGIETLWHQAVQTSELLLMKTAIRANFCDFHTSVTLLCFPNVHVRTTR